MCAEFKSERRGTDNISQCSQSERSCTENLFRERFAGVVYREHIWTGPLPPCDTMYVVKKIDEITVYQSIIININQL